MYIFIKWNLNYTKKVSHSRDVEVYCDITSVWNELVTHLVQIFLRPKQSNISCYMHLILANKPTWLLCVQSQFGQLLA